MASRGIQATRGLYLTCNQCKKPYDLAKLAREAEAKRKNNLYCPVCGQRVGTLQ